MKNLILLLVLIFSLSCQKQIPTSVPDGKYTCTVAYSNGNDIATEILYLKKISENELNISSANSIDSVSLSGKRIRGFIGVASTGYEVDGAWSYNKKTKVNEIVGTFKNYNSGMGGLFSYAYYGTFKMAKKD